MASKRKRVLDGKITFIKTVFKVMPVYLDSTEEITDEEGETKAKKREKRKKKKRNSKCFRCTVFRYLKATSRVQYLVLRMHINMRGWHAIS